MQGLALHTQIKHTANRSSKSLVMTENRVTQFTVTAKYHEPYLQVDDQLSSKQDYTENWRVRVWLFFTEAFRSRGSRGEDKDGYRSRGSRGEDKDGYRSRGSRGVDRGGVDQV